jgi:selenoprotein W-related protein
VDHLLDQYSAYFSEVALKPSHGGRYEISVDGRVVFSKLRQGRFPEEDELDRLIEEAVSA